MSDGMESPTPADSGGDGSGVLGNLPRTRPQRSSPRRAAARRSAAGKAAATAPASRSADGDATSRSAASAAADAPSAGTAETRTARSKGARRNAGQRASGKQTGKRAATGAKRQKRSVPPLDAVPSQGYEGDDDSATGAVRPPGGAELVLSAAEIVGELAKAGLSRSERLLKDVLSRLPLS
jgi:hypothetical protein